MFGDDPDPAGAWRPRAAAIRQRLMRSESDGHCSPTSFPGLAVREAARRRDLAPLLLSVCDRYRPDGRRVPLPRRRAARAQRAGTRASARARIERVPAVDGGFELDGHGSFRHVLLAPGHPGLARPGGARGDPRVVHAYEPHEYATKGGRGRRRDGGGDRVAERARGRRRGRLRAPARARAAAAERRRGRSSPSAASPASTRRRRPSGRGSLRELAEPSYPPGRSWDEPLERAAREGRFRVAARAERRRAGDLRHRLPARLRARPAARPARRPSTSSRREDRWIVLADDSTRAGAHRRDADARARRRRRHSGPSPPRTRSSGMKVAARGFRRRVECMSYTLRGRLETRLAAALLPFLVAACSSPAPARVVAARARRADARDRARARRRALPPAAPVPARLARRCRSGLLELGADDGRGARCSSSDAPLWPARSRSSPAPGCSLQLLAHAGLPLLRLSWPEDGGELGRAGAALAAAAPVALLAVARHRRGRSQPPTVRLAAGEHQGPLVLDHAQTLVGEPGAVVRGGIVITADDVTVRNVTVRGGEYGIEVDERRQRRARRRRRRGRRARRDQRPPQPGRDPRLHDPLAARAPTRRGSTSPSASTSHPSMVEGCTVDRRARGHRHPLRDGDGARQPRSAAPSCARSR